MFRMIVVDDEPLVRKRIVYGFDWQELGFEIIGEASNGLDAMKLIREQRPELAIVDIMMPLFNGIELAKQVMEQALDTRIIFLTGHSEFKYAQEAMRYGVRRYVLKPIDEDEFLLAIQKIYDELENNHSQTEKTRQLLLQNSNAAEILKAKECSDYFHGYADAAPCAVPYAPQANGNTAVFVFRIEEYMHETGEIACRQRDINDRLQNGLPPECQVLCFYDIYEDYIVCACKPFAAWSAERICRHFRGQLSQGFSGEIYCGYAASETRNLQQLFRDAFEALYRTRYTPDRFCAFADFSSSNTHYLIPNDFLKQLHTAVSENQEAACTQIIGRIFTDMVYAGITNRGFFQSCQRILSGLMTECSLAGIPTGVCLGAYHDMQAILKAVWTETELKAWFSNRAIKIIHQKQNEPVGEIENSPVIEKAKNYIDTYYADPQISIAGVAEELQVSLSYLSGSFKKTVGLSAVQYLSVVRLKRARDLLLDTRQSIDSIAAAVGFNDEYYFSKCFKKYYGYSPGQIRKSAHTE